MWLLTLNLASLYSITLYYLACLCGFLVVINVLTFSRLESGQVWPRTLTFPTRTCRNSKDTPLIYKHPLNVFKGLKHISVSFLSLLRGKQIQRPKKTDRYDEDDPEAYKNMPVPDKVRGLSRGSVTAGYKCCCLPELEYTDRKSHYSLYVCCYTDRVFSLHFGQY